MVEIKNILPEEEQNKYLELASKGDYEAQQKLLEHNLGLVQKIINEKFYYLEDSIKEELFQIGSITLWKVILNYNSEFNAKLSSYAIPSIIGEMKA